MSPYRSIHRLARQPPSSQLAQQHHEQWRGIGGSVIDAASAERERGGFPEAHLVQDPARLFLASRVDVLALEPCQRLQHAQGEVGIDQ
jgi:hypothetical protein